MKDPGIPDEPLAGDTSSNFSGQSQSHSDTSTDATRVKPRRVVF